MVQSIYIGRNPGLPRNWTSGGDRPVGRGVSRRGLQGAESGPPAGGLGRVSGRRDGPAAGRVGPCHQDRAPLSGMICYIL